MNDINKVIEALKQLKEDIDQKIEMIAHEKVYQVLNADPSKLNKMEAELKRYIAIIDSGIANNAEIRKAFLGNTSEELNKAVRALVDDEMKSKLASIGITLDTETGKRIEQLDKFDSEDINNLSIDERITNAKKQSEDIRKSIDLGETFEQIQSQVPGIDKKLLTSYLKTLVDDLGKYVAGHGIKSADEYKKLVKELITKSSPKAKKKIPIEEVEKFVEELKKVNYGPEVQSVIDEVTKFKNKVSPSQLYKILNGSELSKDNFDWDSYINKAKSNVSKDKFEIVKENVKKDPAFKYISFVTGKSLDEIESEMERILSENPVDNKKILEQFKLIRGACKKINDENLIDESVYISEHLEEYKLAFKDKSRIIKKLTDIQSKHVTTTTREIFGKKLSVKDQDGNAIDLANKAITSNLINQLYNDLDEESFKKLHEEYQNDPYTEKPGLLKRAFWKITHPSSWFRGYGQLDVLEANYAKSKIRGDLTELQAQTSASWTLSKEDHDRIEKGSVDIVKLRAEQRENIMNGTKTADDAKKSINQEIYKKHEQEDMSL